MKIGSKATVMVDDCVVLSGTVCDMNDTDEDEIELIVASSNSNYQYIIQVPNTTESYAPINSDLQDFIDRHD